MIRGEEETKKFQKFMLEVLNNPKNSQKGDWLRMTWGDMYQKLEFEVDELFDACIEKESKEKRNRIALEAADVACFAMFIADAFGALDID